MIQPSGKGPSMARGEEGRAAPSDPWRQGNLLDKAVTVGSCLTPRGTNSTTNSTDGPLPLLSETGFADPVQADLHSLDHPREG